ncbi:MAG: hypothetical protein K2Y40_12750 [Reyranella sp.]|nr:hypothetical protein [Reyranella sp.]
MMARDPLGGFFPALYPVPGLAQSIVLAAAGNTGCVAVDFKKETTAIGVRVRTANVARIRLGDAAVAATAADMPIAKEDGWLFLSLLGLDAAGDKAARPVRLGAIAEGGGVTVDVVEFN